MTIDSWLQMAIADAEQRGLPDLKPLLDALAGATAALRKADFNDDASGRNPQSATQSAIRTPQSAMRAPRS